MISTVAIYVTYTVVLKRIGAIKVSQYSKVSKYFKVSNFFVTTDEIEFRKCYDKRVDVAISELILR